MGGDAPMVPLLLLLTSFTSASGAPDAAPLTVAPFADACGPVLQQDEQRDPPPAKPPTDAEVSTAVEAVRAALREHDRAAITSALEAAAKVPHRSVVKAVTAALDDDDVLVVVAGLQALRFLETPAALEALHEAAKEREHRIDPEIAVPLFRAIGQHGDPRSIEVLAKNVNEVPDHGIIQARILALGHIRSVEAVEKLIELRVLTGPNGRHRVLEGWKEDFRLSLLALTGVDNGAEADLWERWWRANRKTFEVPEALPPLPADLARRWRHYWGEGRMDERRKRREDRRRDD
jgi:hypothetical protein